MPRTKPPEDNDAPDNVPISGDWSVVKAELQELLEQGRADRIETQAKIVQGSLLLRDAFALAAGGIYATWRSQLLSFDLGAGDIVSNFLNIPGSQAHIVRKIIGELSYSVTGKIKENMEKFVENS
jgi:hypothetical protein